MRVLIALHEDTLGGATRLVLRPVPILRERGWDISFWCTKPSALYDELTALGEPVDGAPRLMRYRLGSLRDAPGVRARVASLPRSLAAFRTHLRELRPDLVHVNGRLALPEGAVARTSGFRVATFIMDDALPGLRGVVGRTTPWLVAHEVMSASTTQGSTLRVGRRVPHVVHANAPEPDSTPRPAKRAGARPVVGTIGVVLERKGTDLFVAMAERLHAAGIEAEFRVAGPLDPNAEIADWGRRLLASGEPYGVRWLGLTDVAAQLREWDVMVMPSRRDPFPLAVLEALSAGVPVVGSAVDGITEQLASGAGVLVPPEDPDALATAVHELLDDPDRRAELAERGRERARDFTLERTANELEAVWRAALGAAAHTTGTR